MALPTEYDLFALMSEAVQNAKVARQALNEQRAIVQRLESASSLADDTLAAVRVAADKEIDVAAGRRARESDDMTKLAAVFEQVRGPGAFSAFV